MKYCFGLLVLICITSASFGGDKLNFAKADQFFHCAAKDQSTDDSVILISRCKVFYTPSVVGNFSFIKIYNSDPLGIDSAVVETRLIYSKTNKNGYIVNTIGDSIIVDRFEIKNFKVSGWYESYNLEASNLIQFRMRYKNGKLHGPYYMFGTTESSYKGKLLVHKIYKKGREKRTILDVIN